MRSRGAGSRVKWMLKGRVLRLVISHVSLNASWCNMRWRAVIRDKPLRV